MPRIIRLSIGSLLLLFAAVSTAQAVSTTYTVAETTDVGILLLNKENETVWYVTTLDSCPVSAEDTVSMDQESYEPGYLDDLYIPSGACKIDDAYQVTYKAYVNEYLGDDQIIITSGSADGESEEQYLVEYISCETIGQYVNGYIYVYSKGGFLDGQYDRLILHNGEVCTVWMSTTDIEGGFVYDDESMTELVNKTIRKANEVLADLQSTLGESHPDVCEFIRGTLIPASTEIRKDLLAEEQISEVVAAKNVFDDYITELRRLLRECTAASATAGSIFSDVPSTHTAYIQIMRLRDIGVLKGYDDGTFRPNSPVNRAELIKIIAEGFFSDELMGEKNCFPDVKDEWYSQYVCAAKRMGWIGGYPDGTFRPGNTVNRAEAIKIIIASGTDDRLSPESLPEDVKASDWFAPFVRKALEIGIETSRGAFRPGENLTRKDAAIWIYNGEQP